MTVTENGQIGLTGIMIYAFKKIKKGVDKTTPIRYNIIIKRKSQSMRSPLRKLL
jgi:hypothetical protein